MPTRNAVLTDRQTALVARPAERREIGEERRLKSLREAVSIGVADIEAGRFREFDAAAPLRDRLSILAEDALRAAR